MVDTKIALHPDVFNNISHFDAFDIWNVPTEHRRNAARKLFDEHRVLSIDDIEWEADLDVLATNRVDKHKPYDDEELHRKYTKSNAPDVVKAELAKLEVQIEDIFRVLYGEFDDAKKAFSWRPMIVGPEPIHFDGYVLPNTTTICSFVNFDTQPRVWRVSYTLPGLIKSYPKMVRDLWDQAIETKSSFNAILRHRTFEGQPPFDVFHEIEFGQGAIWFCNPKTVSHGIHYGRGACLYALHVKGLNIETLQENIIKEAFRAGAL